MAPLTIERQMQPAPAREQARPAIEPRGTIVTRAERAECTCPEACERDHELD
jgi:hypothetical protein